VLWLICIVRFATRQLQSEPKPTNVVEPLDLRERRSNGAWWTMKRLWLRPLQIVTVLLYVCIFKRDEQRRDYRRRTTLDKLLSRAHDVIERSMTRLGDWILKCRSNPGKTQRRKLQSALKRHASRSRTMGLAMSVLAMHARTAVSTERMTQFDTDGEWVGVDNRCTGCISHVRSDFVSDLTAS
jgi:hypothetical protein